MKEYYEHRAREYDATSYELTLQSPEAARDLADVSRTVFSLTHGRVLDIGCGTGWLTRSIAGQIVGVDGSPTMLKIAAERIPEGEFVLADVPPLPFEDDEFDVALSSNFYGHLESTAQREEFLAEALRVASEVVLVEPAWQPGLQAAGWEERETGDGARYTIFRRYFTARDFASEIDGEVMLDTPSFVVVLSRRSGESTHRRSWARELLIQVDRSEPATLSRQVERQIRDAILSGMLPRGFRLPSSRVLAEDVGVSRGVISRAYSQLAFEGHVSLRKGSVPTVCTPARFDRAVEPGRERPKVRYDLRGHLPDVSTFPRKAWLRSMRDSLARARDADLSYGDAAGLWQLRVEVANYLARARGVSLRPDNLVITNGTTNALSLIARALARRGQTRIALENPSHHGFHHVARSAGQKVAAIPVDENGMRIDLLGSAGAAAVVVSPIHQYPMGVALSQDRRRALISWAEEADALVVEDDYDAEFRYDRTTAGALQSQSPQHVAYLGSTGKTLAPAIRIGWAVLPDALFDDVSRELSATILQVSGVDQLALAEFLRRGEFDRHLREMRALYRQRRDILVEAVERFLPQFPVRGLSAGLHLVLETPSHEVAEGIRVEAALAGITIESIADHTLPGYKGPAGVVVGFGAVPCAALETVAQELGRAARTAERSSALTETAA